VGAPNVGKSTLFNRLLGRRQAIVADQPGVTRDRLMADCELLGRPLTLVDTGGVVEDAPDDLTRRVRQEAIKAVEAADLILFLVDARAGLTVADEQVASLLRGSGRPVILVGNKIDSRAQEGFELELHRLGLGEVLAVSAEQGRGLDDLVDAVASRLPPVRPEAPAPGVPMALLGRPNVGKSALFNRIVRLDRSVVSERPGTTRDPVDATFEHDGILYRIVDTAGIRRRTTGAGSVEWLSILKARQAVARSEIAIAIVDAASGAGHQDRALLGHLMDGRKPTVLAINKIDLVEDAGRRLDERIEAIRGALRFSRFVPAVPVSAKTGRGIASLLDTATRLRSQSRRRFPTPELNRALRAILEERHPPSDGGKDVRLHYITQAPGAPPRFVVFGNGRRVAAAYRRFLESRLRARLGLDSCPLSLRFRKSD
jgi:GTP-binding protein